jgi:hypothetical protein
MKSKKKLATKGILSFDAPPLDFSNLNIKNLAG